MKRKLNCILLVDDDPATNFLHKRVIDKEQVAEKIETVEHGEAALDFLHKLAAEKQPPPELILLDINMPVMNGWDFLEDYNRLPDAEKGDTVIIMLTTSMNPDDQSRSAAFPHVKWFKFKPLDKEMLHELLEQNFAG